MKPKRVRLGAVTTSWTLRLVQGRNRDYGLPEPRGSLFSQHLTVNSELFYAIRHGEIHTRPGVARFDGDHVIFTDGRREQFEIVIATTGYRISFPFFGPALIDFSNALRLPLFKKMLHADYASLFFIGLFQPLGCIWPLADHQARLAVAEILGAYRRPADMRTAIRWEQAHPHFPFEPTLRHAVEVDYHRFRRELLAELSGTGRTVDGRR